MDEFVTYQINLPRGPWNRRRIMTLALRNMVDRCRTVQEEHAAWGGTIPKRTLRHWRSHFKSTCELPETTKRGASKGRTRERRKDAMPEEHRAALKSIVDERPELYLDEIAEAARPYHGALPYFYDLPHAHGPQPHQLLAPVSRGKGLSAGHTTRVRLTTPGERLRYFARPSCRLTFDVFSLTRKNLGSHMGRSRGHGKAALQRRAQRRGKWCKSHQSGPSPSLSRARVVHRVRLARAPKCSKFEPSQQ